MNSANHSSGDQMVQTFEGLGNKVARFFMGQSFNLRKEVRYLANFVAPLKILQTRRMPQISVNVLDFSKGGLAFAVKGKKIALGDQIRINFRAPTGEDWVYEGEVVSRILLYPGNAELMEPEVTRISVSFHQEIEVGAFNELKRQFQMQPFAC
jgi:hypothetical protein